MLQLSEWLKAVEKPEKHYMSIYGTLYGPYNVPQVLMLVLASCLG